MTFFVASGLIEYSRLMIVLSSEKSVAKPSVIICNNISKPLKSAASLAYDAHAMRWKHHKFSKKSRNKKFCYTRKWRIKEKTKFPYLSINFSQSITRKRDDYVHSKKWAWLIRKFLSHSGGRKIPFCSRAGSNSLNFAFLEQRVSLDKRLGCTAETPLSFFRV